MKLRYATILALIALVLTACNFTLAEDITPPPDYVPPTPVATLGPLFPAQAPDVQNGAVIYAEKCSPCHGNTGLGDGEKGKQLPVTVAAFALPETAHKASPAQWFTTVTQGNLDRYMPPFVSLDDQQRWDVVAYALTLHTTPEQIEKGKTLYETNCASCHADGFTQEYMAGKSAEALVSFTMKGHDKFPASKLSEDESYSVAAYMRTLTFALPTPTSSPASTTGTPSAVGTPSGGTAQAQVPTNATTLPTGHGNVRGSLDNKTGSSLPSDLVVTLRAYEHTTDPQAGPQEIFNLEAPVQADGTYVFENVDMPENRIFIAEVTYQGITLKSNFDVAKAGTTELALSAITLYNTTTDTSVLKIEDASLFFDFANETDAQVVALYTITNNTDKTVLVKAGTDLNIPFIKFPEGWKAQGFQDSQNSATFAPTTDGFAMPPSKTPYELLAFASLPTQPKMEFNQQFVLPITSVRIILPDGMKASGDQLTDTGVQLIQNTNFQTYAAAHLEAGSKLTFTISGNPKGVTKNTNLDSKQMVLIGAGTLGLVLIIVGVWMYMRDRKRGDDEDEQGDFASSEDVMDAIIALDDLHRAGKISDEAYQKRRDELKQQLKTLE